MVWVKLDCPRCNTCSPVAATLVGQYTACPACQARVLVPINAAKAGAPDGSSSAMPAIPPLPASPAAGGAPRSGPAAQFASAQTWTASGPPGPLSASSNGPQPTRQAIPQLPVAPGAVAGRPTVGPGNQPAGRPVAGPGTMTVPALFAAAADLPLSPPRADAPVAGSVPLAAPPVASQPGRPGYATAPPPVAFGGTGSFGGTGPGVGMVPAVGVAAPPIMPSMPGRQVPLAPALPAPAGTRKVARFIAPDSAQSTIQLAPDGQLPSLELVDAGQAATAATKTSTINPLLLLAAIAASFCVSVILLTADLDSDGSQQKLGQLRRQLETYYKGQREPFAPYQVHLREAQQAFSRGDHKSEAAHYRKVLDLLHAEGGSRFRGVTGTPASDKKLEETLSILLGRDFVEVIQIE